MLFGKFRSLRWKTLLLLGITLITFVSVLVYWMMMPCKVSPADIRRFSEVMGALIAEGKSLAQCFLLAAERERNPALRRILLKLHSDVLTKSLPLYALMAEYPEAFNAEFVFAVKHGARMGRIDTVLKELSRQWPDEPEKQREAVRKIIKTVAIESLNDPRDWFYRLSALQSLAELGDRDVVFQILPLLQDPIPRVREAAKETLQRLGYTVK